MPSTVLVFCYKYKSLDRRRKITKTLAKNAVLFESKKLYDNQVPSWLQSVAKEEGYTISPKATHMLVEFLGTDLSKIKNELDKLQLIRSEEHTSELQSRGHLVCRLLLEKKNNKK